MQRPPMMPPPMGAYPGQPPMGMRMGAPPPMPPMGMGMGMMPPFGAPGMPGGMPGMAGQAPRPNMPITAQMLNPIAAGDKKFILPPHIMDLFKPNNPPTFWKGGAGGKSRPYDGLTNFVQFFEEEEPPEREITETPKQRQDRKKREKQLAHLKEIEEKSQSWDPHHDPNADSDPHTTCFVGRLSYETNEKKLRKEFEIYGPIKQIHLVSDKEGKPRGYAFIEYENEADMIRAVKDGDGRKIDNRRVVVDVERGRTVSGWKPRRLGGGLGGTRFGPPSINFRHSGRHQPVPIDPLTGAPDMNVLSDLLRGQDTRDRDRDRDRERDSRDFRDRREERPRERERERDYRAVPPPDNRDRDRHRERSRSRDRDRGDRRDRDRERERRDRR